MRPHASLWIVIAGAITLASSGCSYAFVHGPPPTWEGAPDDPQAPRSTRVDCTSSNAVPVVDTVLAVPLIGAGVLAIVAGASSGSCSGWGCVGPSSGAAAGVGVAVAALGTLLLSSAVTGYGRTADCRRAVEALPTGPRSTGRHLLDVPGIAQARVREERTE